MKQLLVLTTMLIASGIPANSAEWNQLRGPDSVPVVDNPKVPVRITDQDILWKAELPGVGYNSPVFHGERVYLMQAEGEPASEGVRVVYALNTADGSVIWSKKFPYTGYRQHKANHPSASNLVVDEHGIYGYWFNGSSVEAVGLSHEGAVKWKQDFGSFANRFGFGTSPSLVGGVLLLPFSQNFADSRLIGLDPETGKTRWTYVSKAEDKCGYGQAVAMPIGDRMLAVYSTRADGVVAIDVKDGSVAWQQAVEFAANRVNMPAVYGNRVVVTSGLGRNGRDAYLFEVATDGNSVKRVADIDRGASYVPTPLLTDDFLLMWNDIGIVSCFTADGEFLWRKRITADTNSSPVLINGQVVNISMDGEYVSFPITREEPAEPFRYQLDQRVNATPAVYADRLYLRPYGGLWSLGK